MQYARQVYRGKMVKNKKTTRLILWSAFWIAVLHHFVGHWFLQGMIFSKMTFFNSLPAIFLGTTFGVTIYIFLLVWFVNKMLVDRL